MTKRIADDLIRSLNEAVDYAEGKEVNVRLSKMSIQPLPRLQPDEIRTIRMNSKYTQSTLANALGVTQKAVEAWECGRNVPQGPSLRLLMMLKNDPHILEKTGVVNMQS